MKFAILISFKTRAWRMKRIKQACLDTQRFLLKGEAPTEDWHVASLHDTEAEALKWAKMLKRVMSFSQSQSGAGAA